MNEFIHNCCKELNIDLKQIDSETSDILKKSERSIRCIDNCLKQLKECVCQNQFTSQEEEIEFFKVIKPSVYSKLIYFVKVFHIESKRPMGSEKSQKKYYLNELKKLEIFFSENLEFYQYIRNNLTYLDDKYFVRGKIDLRLYADTFYFDADHDFSTGHDFKVAKIKAHDLLSVYLNSQIAALERKESTNTKSTNYPKGKYAWSASKSAMVELIYALHAANAINDGNVDIKELAVFFENTFYVDLSDIYRTFLEIKSRNQPAKFLDTLKNALTVKINEQLE